MFSYEVSKVKENGLLAIPKVRRKNVKIPNSRLRISLDRHKYFWEDERIYKANPGDVVEFGMDVEFIGTWRHYKEDRSNPDYIGKLYTLNLRHDKDTDENLAWIIERYPIEDGHIFISTNDSITLHRMFDKNKNRMLTRDEWVELLKITDRKTSINSLNL